MDIQIRYNDGMIAKCDNLGDALEFNNGDWDKVSFSVSDYEDERFIIWRDGTWEHRTPKSLKQQAFAEYEKVSKKINNECSE
ncbi:hypothetical protein LCGC14_1794330 [marine sediment metagenome]|uniref:Uncharacterized protein n=1 Tax=marine sediment metagenome TaxID=412755 RepID=A0A0F9J6C6_9ZZZZ